MHEFAKKILECVKSKVDTIGIENFEGQNLDDLKDWTEIVKNIVCFDKDYHIVEAMKESENDDIMEMLERYEDYPGRRYYDEYRYKSSGRYAPKGRGTYVGRRGYEEPPYYHMTPEMYREHDPSWYRDMDRMNGKMYYTETGNMPAASESRYDRAKRMYTESKSMHKDNSTESKQAKMRDLEQYTKELAEDVTNLITDMSQEEKALLKSRMQVLMQKIQ